MRLKHHYLFAFLLLGFLSCGPKPEVLEIPEEIMINVLSDIHIAEGALLSIRPQQKDSLRKLYYNQVYEIHEISGDAFERDMKILKLHPKMMEKLYEKVLEELNEKEAKLQEKEAQTKK